jgi:two-component system, NarL family, nitrate/nitrite response regulator NarL
METSARTAPITVVIADDHPLFREALRTLLQSDPALCVVGEASNGRDAIALAQELHPDILLLDLQMPITPGLAALRELSMLTPPVRTLLLTAEVRDSDVLEALQLGARGVVMKHSATELLFKGIHTVMSGQYWIGRSCVADLIESMRARQQPSAAEAAQATFGLTPRQLEIVSAIVAGATNQDIAEQFSISSKTVKYHLTLIFDKLGVSNRIELALFAVQHRLDPTVHDAPTVLPDRSRAAAARTSAGSGTFVAGS